MDPDMEELPTDYTAGVDFRLVKRFQRRICRLWCKSNWARRERPLTDAEMAAVNTHGLFNLLTFFLKSQTKLL